MYSILKRIFDLLFSFIGLVLLTPLFIPIIILLRISGEGEVFYRQMRIGCQKRPFGILKFATMLKDSVNLGSGMVTVRNDPRITPFGGILRRYKINELPQLWNVFIGDMSFVGPRPLPHTSVIKFELSVQTVMLQNRPGITGIGSLIFRDEEKLISLWKKGGKEPLDYYRNYIYPYKGKLEMWYSIHKGFLTDFNILILTFWSLFQSNSNLPYRIFKSLPEKPIELGESWIIKVTGK